MSGLSYVTGTPIVVTKGTTVTLTTGCPIGKSVISGGYDTDVTLGSSASVDFILVSSSYFDIATMSWKVTVTNLKNGNGNQNKSLTVTPYAVCVIVQ